MKERVAVFSRIGFASGVGAELTREVNDFLAKLDDNDNFEVNDIDTKASADGIVITVWYTEDTNRYDEEDEDYDD